MSHDDLMSHDDPMGHDPSALIVRYSPGAREHFDTKVVPHARKHANRLMVYGAVLALVMIGAMVVLVVLGEGLTVVDTILIGALLLVLPTCVFGAGVKKFRRKLSLPDVVLTVTDDHLVLGHFKRMGLLSYGRPELTWDRRATQATFLSGDGVITHDRVKFTQGEGLKRRSHSVAVDALDTSAEEILAAMGRP